MALVAYQPGPLPSPFTTAAAGVTFIDGYLNVLARLEGDALLDRDTSIRLVRHPENPYDSNAVRIERADGTMLGHVPRKLAERLAPELDAGVVWNVRLLWAGGQLDRMGVRVELSRG